MQDRFFEVSKRPEVERFRLAFARARLKETLDTSRMSEQSSSGHFKKKRQSRAYPYRSGGLQLRESRAYTLDDIERPLEEVQ